MDEDVIYFYAEDCVYFRYKGQFYKTTQGSIIDSYEAKEPAIPIQPFELGDLLFRPDLWDTGWFTHRFKEMVEGYEED